MGKTLAAGCTLFLLITADIASGDTDMPKHAYNGSYTGAQLNRIAFPLGGLGAGMICIEGTGAFSHVSVRNKMDFFNAPCLFSAICVKGKDGNVARILEGPIPDWKYFGAPGTGNGAAGTSYGLPRFGGASFLPRFPFADIQLRDNAVPIETVIAAWSPFIPGDADRSSLPVAGIEYQFRNPGGTPIEAVFSFNSKNFMAAGKGGNAILPIQGGFILDQEEHKDAPQDKGAFAAFVLEDGAVVDHCWFKGGWWDSLTLAWRNIQEGILRDNPPVEGESPGASLFVPFTLAPNETKTIHLLFAWYVPATDIRIGKDGEACEGGVCCASKTHVPWYAGRFKDIGELTAFWRTNYASLRDDSAQFRDTFYDTTLPPEAVEAVAANLTILKSPTVQRQTDGRMWCFEGCCDNVGCCHGSCTHVWNYAQAIAHLFPELERSLRQTEFNESQDAKGHQQFRSNLPIRPVAHDFHAAADGQLGGIMKVYREWRICGDTKWLETFWPKVRKSLDYCIQTWDPRGKGTLEEPHHNTYDIEYWGPDGHCTSFYLGALAAAVEMGKALGDDVSRYARLLKKGRAFIETELFNGEYFYQKIQTDGLNAKFHPLDASDNGKGYSDIVSLLNEQGPKYQYGTGCLSDGVLGFWLARACGLDAPVADPEKVRSHLKAVHTYNLKRDLSAHANPQRPSYAMGDEGGLLLCTWPRGGALAIPFVYSDEVWTGIEYQVASHLILEGMTQEGLDIVRTCRDRYDGVRRNPFNEYECGHWYGRALSSYGLLQALTGARYDAVDKALYIDSRVGDDFRGFLCTASGYGTVGLKKGRPFLEVKSGKIPVERVFVSGRKMPKSSLQ